MKKKINFQSLIFTMGIVSICVTICRITFNAFLRTAYGFESDTTDALLRMVLKGGRESHILQITVIFMMLICGVLGITSALIVSRSLCKVSPTSVAGLTSGFYSLTVSPLVTIGDADLLFSGSISAILISLMLGSLIEQFSGKTTESSE